MRNLYNWSKKHIIPWLSKAISYTVLLIYIWLIWQVIAEIELETSQLNPTQIKLDLLQVSAFLVAWSGLLIAITSKVISNFRDLDLRAREVGWWLEKHTEEHPDWGKRIEGLGNQVIGLKEEYGEFEENLQRVQNENEQLIAENEQLRRQIQGFEEVADSGSNRN